MHVCARLICSLALGMGSPLLAAQEGGTPEQQIADLDKRGLAIAPDQSLDQKEEFLREALHLRISHFGAGSMAAAAGYNNLALNLDGQRRFVEAENLHRLALAARQRLSGESNADTAWSLNNLGVNLCRQERCAAGKELIARAHAIRVALLGTAHADTVAAKANLDLSTTMIDRQAAGGGMRPAHMFALEEQAEKAAFETKAAGGDNPGSVNTMAGIRALFPRYFAGFVRARPGNGRSTAGGEVTEYASLFAPDRSSILVTIAPTKLPWPSLWLEYALDQRLSTDPELRAAGVPRRNTVFGADGVTPIAEMIGFDNQRDSAVLTFSTVAVGGHLVVIQSTAASRPTDHDVTEFIAAMRRVPFDRRAAPLGSDQCAHLPVATAVGPELTKGRGNAAIAVAYKIVRQFYPPDATKSPATASWPSGIPFCLRRTSGFTVATDPAGVRARIDGYFMPVDGSGAVVSVTRVGALKTAYGVSLIRGDQAKVIAVFEQMPAPTEVLRVLSNATPLVLVNQQKDGKAILPGSDVVRALDPNDSDGFMKSTSDWLDDLND